MTSLITRASAVVRSQDSSVSIVFDPTTNTRKCTVFIRTIKGIRFLETSFGSNLLDINTIFLNALVRGNYSKRPYHLGDPIDASHDNCVLALFHNLCEVRNLKAHGIANLAYQDSSQTFTNMDFAEIMAQSLWEDYSVPEKWDATSVMMLFKALEDAGYSRIRGVLETILRTA
ncbi:MAG: hypothetical protein JSR66_32800 [Proteobacteria bacterium]|nr:hypothetical protein [Pseudomonadota bacterium]